MNERAVFAVVFVAFFFAGGNISIAAFSMMDHSIGVVEFFGTCAVVGTVFLFMLYWAVKRAE